MARPSTQALPLYQVTAERLARMITGGTYRPGDRIPSVRELSTDWGISVTTVLEAYRRLERQGLIAAQPQSGYYVQSFRTAAAGEIGACAPGGGPLEVGVACLARTLMKDARDPRLLPLGAAVPNPAAMPLAEINRLVAAAARSDPTMSAYGQVAGFEPLRQQIARHLVASGCAVEPSQVLVTSGCQEAITLALRATCRPGDVVAIESPIFYGILQTIEALGLKVVEIPSHPRDGLSLPHLEQALAAGRISACVAIPTYGNPLGGCMPPDAKRDLARLLARHEIPLIEDDIYGDLGHDGARAPTVKSFDRKGLVILCSSFSKTVSPGLRVGYVVPGRWFEAVQDLKFTTNVATASIPQAAVAGLLAGGGYDRHLRRLRRRYAEQVAAMSDAVLQHFPDGTRATRPLGGHLVWVELPASVDAMRLYAAALKAGITTAPGMLFSASKGYTHHLRLNAAWWSREIDQALATIGRLARRMA